MKILLLTWLLALPGGDREQGLQLYREGRYAEAAAAFQRALQSDGDSPELQWNLALAHWHAGDLVAAETAAEKYAATSPAVQVELHRGLLGAIRYQQALAKVAEADQAQAAAAAPPTAPAGAAAPAPADPLPLLQAALAKANQARDHFVRGAKAAATPELRRNIERTLRLIDELKRRIEELEKQRQPSEDKDQKDSKKEEKPDESKQDDKKPEEKPEQKPDEQKPDEQKPEEQKNGEKKNDEQKNGEQEPDDGKQAGEQGQDQGQPQAGQDPAEPKPEPASGKAGDEPAPQPKPGETGDGADAAPEPVPGSDDKDSKPRQDAPGELQEPRELSPEQTQRLLERLQGLDGKQKAIRARVKSSRRPVERDW